MEQGEVFEPPACAPFPRLYPCSERAKSTEHLVKLWFKDLNGLLERAGPRKSVTLALDGVPPAAKLFVQRERRARPLLETGDIKWKDEQPGGGVDTLNFTVGTPVSTELRDALAFFSVQARPLPCPPSRPCHPLASPVMQLHKTPTGGFYYL